MSENVWFSWFLKVQFWSQEVNIAALNSKVHYVQKLVVVVVVLPEAKSLINCLAGYAPLIFFFCAIFLIARQTTAHLVAFLRVLYRGCWSKRAETWFLWHIYIPLHTYIYIPLPTSPCIFPGHISQVGVYRSSISRMGRWMPAGKAVLRTSRPA